MSELIYLSASEVLLRFRSRDLSPVEVMEAILARAKSVEPTVNAFAQTFFGEAMASARTAEARYRRGAEPPRPLVGLPVAIKEEERGPDRWPHVR